MSDEEIVQRAEALCERMSRHMGYRSTGKVPFRESTHGRRVLIWGLVRLAFEELLQTDIDDAVTCAEEERLCQLPAYCGDGI